MMNIEEIDLRTIDERDARAAAELLVTVWPKPGRTVDSLTQSIREQWRDYEGHELQHPRSLLIRENGRTIGHASIYPRTLDTGTGPLTVLALARVCTDPAMRGKKIGENLVREAFKLVDNGTFPFALFQTGENVKNFYERLGAVPVGNVFINSLASDQLASPFWDKYIMHYPNSPTWPAGPIDLRGPGW